MPHLTLQYTDNVRADMPFAAMFDRMHDVLVEVGQISRGNCKSRAVALQQFYVADGSGAGGFVHLDVRFLEGRSPETKAAIGRDLLAILRESFPPSDEVPSPQLTVEIRDIAPGGYFKHPAGTLGFQGDR